MTALRSVVSMLVALTSPASATAAEPAPRRDEVVAAMRPYAGPTVAGVDVSTLFGKLMVGYQGWFTTPGDGVGRGFRHYSKRGEFRPGRCSIDLWPDVGEFPAAEREATEFRHADGRPAEVFSSYRASTVLRHFEWMRTYGLDGAFVQRFVVETSDPRALRHCNAVLGAAREGANRSGRGYAVMYDLSGLRAGETARAVDDWKLLVDRMRLGRDDADRAYFHHRGRPVVAVWGVGFGDGRDYTLAECARLIDFLKHDPRYGGNTVLVGVPTGWRTLDRDAVGDAALHDVLRRADVVSPWTVGRYHSPETAERHARRDVAADLDWCRTAGLDYLPVVFPGFSWHNLKSDAPVDQIPRLKGAFLWSQISAAKRAGAAMLYVAMFDELDEATAIFKCTNDPPVGASPFLTYEGLPSDYYLRLAGAGARMLRGELAPDAPQPEP